MRIGSSPGLGRVVTLGLALLGLFTASTDSRSARSPEKATPRWLVGTKTLKSAPIGKQTFVYMVSGIEELEDAAGESGTADLRKGFLRVRAMADTVKLDLAALAKRITTNGEAGDFDAMVMSRAIAQAGKPAGTLAAEITKAGGPYKALTSGNVLVDREMNELKTSLRLSDSGSILEILAAPALAGEKRRSASCYWFWFVVAAAYGTEIAYQPCG